MSETLATVLFALGGGLGACARHAVGTLLAGRPTRATLAVNVLGSALLGSLAGAAVGGDPGAPAGLLIGFCGGFTTFSSFAWQTLELGRTRTVAHAAVNVAASLVGSVGAFAAGAALAGAP